MQDLIYTFSVISPIFILIGLGFFSVRQNYLKKEELRSLSWFLLNFGLPAAIYNALSSRSISEILNFNYLFIYGIGSLLAFSLIFGLSKLRGKSLTESSIFALGSSISNSLMIGYPIVMQVFGPAALLPFALTIMVENILIIPLSMTLAETGKHKGASFLRALLSSLKQLSRSPLLIAIILGVLTTLSPVKPPAFVNSTISLLAATVVGMALFTIGGMLVGLKPGGIVTDLSSVLIGKLMIHPACILIMIFLMPPMEPLFQSVAIILSTLPMFGIYAVIGSRYGMGQFCSAASLMATTLSFFTISLSVWLVGTI